MTRDDALRLLLPASFTDFVQEFWPVASPDPLIWGRHLDTLCAHLQAVATGEVRNLLVNLPPRHSKSLVTTVLFPVWLWLRDQTHRIITASYSKKLSNEHALLSRRVLESAPFRRLFPQITLADDTNRQDHYKNGAGGERLAVSVGSSTTGFNATVIIVDDLHAVQDRESEAERRSALDFYRLALSSRAVPGRAVPRIVLGQRVHADDVSGYCLANLDESWSCLVLPLEFDPARPALPNRLGFVDWRTEAGELLWPEAFDAARVRQIKTEHRHDFACLYQQDVEGGAGDLFRRDWFRYYTETDTAYLLNGRAVRKSACTRIMAVDLAVSTSATADWTVAIVADLQGGDIIIRHVHRARHDGTRLVPAIKGVADTFKPVFVAVERAGQQAIVIDQLRAAGVLVRPVKPEGDKESRSIPAQIKFESGQVWFPQGQPWVADLEAELLSFPRGRHDDQVDALSYLVLMAQRYDRSEPEPTEEQAEAKWKEAREQHFQKLLWAGLE